MDKKAYILNAFRTSQNIYLKSIARELRIDIKEVVEICKQLVNSGKIYLHDPEAFDEFYLPKKKNWFSL